MGAAQRGVDTVTNREYLRSKLAQGADALQEARALFAEGAELGFVMSNLYFAFLYPILGLLKEQGASVTTQNVALTLFEKDLVEKGVYERRFLDAFRRAFELRPACACDAPKVILKQDIEELLPIAQDFLAAVEKLIA